MILEGIVTTLDTEGRLNVAPMGPIVDAEMNRLVLRPFQTSQTYRNLKRRPAGVFHVVDDVLLLAKAAVGRLDFTPETIPAQSIDGRVLSSACRWYEFEVESLDDSQERTEIVARVVQTGRLHDFFGFNRAKHAVIEAAILATRLHMLPREDVLRQFAALRSPVEKTAGPPEREAFDLLERFVREHVASAGRPVPRKVRVETGSRLHIGPLAVGATAGRQFGGLGLMIDQPGFELTAEYLASDAENDLLDIPACHREAAERTLSRARAGSVAGALRSIRLGLQHSIPAHAGLGSGTQLALAIGRALAELEGASPSAAELAARVGRGTRSAIGTEGFDRGGLILDGGKRAPDQLGVIAARIDMPDWRIVLIVPQDATGISGPAERQAFGQLSPMPAETTDRLCRLVLMGLLPAVRENDFAAASESLYDYGRAVGEYFAPVQGGVYAHPAMREVVPLIRSWGTCGVGQTSWGPSLFALAPEDAAAAELCERLAREPLCRGCRLITAKPMNSGASVVATP